MTVQYMQLNAGYETQFSNNYPLTDFTTGTQYVQQHYAQPVPMNQQQVQQFTTQASPQISYVPAPNCVPVPVFVQPQYSPCFDSSTLPPPSNSAMTHLELTPSALTTVPAAPAPFQVPNTIQVQHLGQSPVFQPIPMSRSPSPAFGAMSSPFFQRTPSPSPSPSSGQDVVMQNVMPDLSQCKTLYELDIIRHQATVQSIDEKYGGAIADAMRKVLGNDVWYLFVIVAEQEKSMTIQWAVHPGHCDFEALQRITSTKDFEKRLICELAFVGNGAFNRHLHGSKQLTIISEGRKCFDRLKHALESYNDAKNNLLKSHAADKFDQKNIDDLFRVCEAPRGSALRGNNVVGGHFRGGDVLRLNNFLDIVEQKIGSIKKATMIPSMKGKAQYKGWSIYVETPSAEHVGQVKEACKEFNFEKAEIFTAVDRFQYRND